MASFTLTCSERKTALKNGYNFPRDWNDVDIQKELSALTERISQCKSTDSAYPTAYLIHDIMQYNMGHGELQNRKTNRLISLLVFIAMVTCALAGGTVWLGYEIQQSVALTEKAQKAGDDILSMIEKRLGDMAADLSDIREYLIEDNTEEPEPEEPEQTGPMFRET